MKTLNWGLLGTARINRSLIPPLRLSVRNNLLAVASRTQGRANAYAEEWAIPRAYGSYEEMLADDEIDVVYIPLPNTLHAEWAIKAAEAGKHVLCEKPLALSVEQVDSMVEASDKAGTVLIEAFMYRFHARTLKVKQMVEDGVIGDLHHIKGGFTFSLNRPGDVRWDPVLGGGSLWDVGCYPLSFSRYIAGKEPEEVYAYQVLGQSGIDESFLVSFDLEMALLPNSIQVFGPNLECTWKLRVAMDPYMSPWHSNPLLEVISILLKEIIPNISRLMETIFIWMKSKASLTLC